MHISCHSSSCYFRILWCEGLLGLAKSLENFFKAFCCKNIRHPHIHTHIPHLHQPITAHHYHLPLSRKMLHICVPHCTCLPFFPLYATYCDFPPWFSDNKRICMHTHMTLSDPHDSLPDHERPSRLLT